MAKNGPSETFRFAAGCTAVGVCEPEGSEEWDTETALFPYGADEICVPGGGEAEEQEEQYEAGPRQDDLDLVQAYLKEVGVFPLLTREDEVDIGIRIEQGRKRALKALSRMSPETKRIIIAKAEKRHTALEATQSEKSGSLSKRELEISGACPEPFRHGMQEYEDARRKLINSNLRLVISIAKKYTGRGLSFLDLIQEGNIGLMKAADKFDYHRGNKFSVLATWWIRQGIQRALADTSRTVRIPSHLHELLQKIYRAANELSLESLDQESTHDKIAKYIGVPAHRVSKVLGLPTKPLSLETPIGNDGTWSLGDLIADRRGADPLDLLLKAADRRKTERLMKGLSPIERSVIEMSYLDGEIPPRKIAAELNAASGRHKIIAVQVSGIKKQTMQNMRSLASKMPAIRG